MAEVSDITRKAAWDTLCDLEWHIRYCSAMADRNHLKHRVIRVAILVSVVVEGGLLYGGTINPWVFVPGAFVALALACITVWDVTSNYANDAAVFRMAVILCQRLKTETGALWRDIESDRRTTDEIEGTLKRIQGQWGDVTQSIPLGIDEKLNQETAKAANKEIQNQYGIQVSNVSA